MAPSASRRGRRNQPAPGPGAVERATGPAAVPWLPPPAAFARKLDHPTAAAATGAPPAAFARRPGPAAPNPSPPAEATRSWAALPLDALAAVLRRLDHVEILMGPARVCCAARDDPALWRRIDMRGHADLHRRVDLCGMARAAVCSAKGRCKAFWAEYTADDDVLQLLGEQ